MRRAFRTLAAVLAVASLAVWLATGAHRGWTQTSVPQKTPDPVTGIEGITYERGFIMGMDLLAAAWLGAGLLAGASVLFRKQSNTNRTNSVETKTNPIP
jgi:hypothetical protein